MAKLKQGKNGELIEQEEVIAAQEEEVTEVTEVTKKSDFDRDEYLKEVYKTQPEYLRPTNRR